MHLKSRGQQSYAPQLRNPWVPKLRLGWLLSSRTEGASSDGSSFEASAFEAAFFEGGGRLLLPSRATFVRGGRGVVGCFSIQGYIFQGGGGLV